MHFNCTYICWLCSVIIHYKLRFGFIENIAKTSVQDKYFSLQQNFCLQEMLNMKSCPYSLSHLFPSLRYQYLHEGKKRYSSDGLNSVKYRLLDTQLRRLYTWVYVDLYPSWCHALGCLTREICSAKCEESKLCYEVKSEWFLWKVCDRAMWCVKNVFRCEVLSIIYLLLELGSLWISRHMKRYLLWGAMQSHSRHF